MTSSVASTTRAASQISLCWSSIYIHTPLVQLNFLKRVYYAKNLCMTYSINLIITANFVFKFSSYNILVNVPRYKEKIISVCTVFCIKLTLLSDVLIMSDLCCHCPTHTQFLRLLWWLICDIFHKCLASKRYVGNSISKLQIQAVTYVFELSAGNCHR